MSDHFKFELQVEIYDQWPMAYDERGAELKQKCAEAVKRTLEEYGFRAYRNEYGVFV